MPYRDGSVEILFDFIDHALTIEVSDGRSETIPLEPQSVASFYRKLMATLAVVVNGLGDLTSILPAASALAKRHVTYGAKVEHYPVVGAALLWTLEKGLGEGWTPAIADAWTAAYGTLSGFMITKAYGRPPAAAE